MDFGSTTAYAPMFEQAYDSATFLALLQHQALDRPDMRPAELYDLDQRLADALALLTGWPDLSWPYCETGLSIEEYGEAFVATVVAFRSANIDNIKKVISFSTVNADVFEGVQYALAWLYPSGTGDWLDKFMASDDLNHRCLAAAVYQLVGRQPTQIFFKTMSDQVNGGHAALLTHGLHLIANTKLQHLVSVAGALGKHDDSLVRFASIRAVLMLGVKMSLESIRPFIDSGFSHHKEALYLFFHLADAQAAKDLISSLAADPATQRLAIQAAAAYGDPHTVPWLLNVAQQSAWARLAGEAYRLITGCDLEDQGLVVTDIPDLEDGESPLEDEHLPWPDTAKLAAHWQQVAKQYTPGQRYFLGRHIHGDALKTHMQTAPMRYIHIAALLTAMIDRSAPLKPTRICCN